MTAAIVTVHRGTPLPDDVIAAWRALHRTDPYAAPLTDPESLCGLRQVFAPEVEPLVVVARHGPRIIGVWPLGRRRVRRGLVRVRVLTGLAGDDGYFNDAVVELDASEAAATALAAAWPRLLALADEAAVPRVPRDRPLARALVARLGEEALPVIPRNRVEAPRRATGREAAAIARRRRAFEREHGVLESAWHTASPGVAAAIRRFASLHGTLRTARGGRRPLAEASVRERFGAWFGARAAQGQAGVFELQAGGRLVASQLWLQDARTIVAYRLAWDPALHAFGLGSLAVDDFLAECASRCDVVELGPGDEPYKRKWHPTPAPATFLRAIRPTWRTRAAAAWHRVAGARGLPHGAP